LGEEVSSLTVNPDANSCSVKIAQHILVGNVRILEGAKGLLSRIDNSNLLIDILTRSFNDNSGGLSDCAQSSLMVEVAKGMFAGSHLAAMLLSASTCNRNQFKRSFSADLTVSVYTLKKFGCEALTLRLIDFSWLMRVKF
jgi:hypothetical protein